MSGECAFCGEDSLDVFPCKTCRHEVCACCRVWEPVEGRFECYCLSCDPRNLPREEPVSSVTVGERELGRLRAIEQAAGHLAIAVSGYHVAPDPDDEWTLKDVLRAHSALMEALNAQ